MLQFFISLKSNFVASLEQVFVGFFPLPMFIVVTVITFWRLSFNSHHCCCSEVYRFSKTWCRFCFVLVLLFFWNGWEFHFREWKQYFWLIINSTEMLSLIPWISCQDLVLFIYLASKIKSCFNHFAVFVLNLLHWTTHQHARQRSTQSFNGNLLVKKNMFPWQVDKNSHVL